MKNKTRLNNERKKIVFKDNILKIFVHDQDSLGSILIGIIGLALAITGITILLVSFVFHSIKIVFTSYLIIMSTTTIVSILLFIYVLLIKKKYKYLNLNANTLLIIKVGNNIHLVPKKADIYGNVKIKTPAGDFLIKVPKNKRTGKFGDMDVYLLDIDRGVLLTLDDVKELSEVTQDEELKEVINTYFYLRDQFEELKAQYKDALERGEDEEKLKKLEETINQVKTALSEMEKVYKITQVDKLSNEVIVLTDDENILNRFKNIPILKFFSLENIYDILPLSYVADQLSTLRMLVEKEKRPVDTRLILVLGFVAFLVIIGVVFGYMMIHGNHQQIIVTLPNNLTQQVTHSTINNTTSNVTVVKLP